MYHGFATKYQKIACGVEGGNHEYRVGIFLSQRVASKERARWKYQVQAELVLQRRRTGNK